MKIDDFKEIWFVDFEFSQDENLIQKPICMVAIEYYTKKEHKVWLWGDPSPEMPFNVGPDVLYVAYYASAEIGCYLELDWSIPTHILDLYVEYRNLTNGKKTAYSRGLIGALAHFGLDPMLATEKAEMRELAIRGGPFTDVEASALMDYCAGDVHALVNLFPKMIPYINIGQSLIRGRYMWAIAKMERNGIPIDLQLLQELQNNWEEIKLKLVEEVDQDFQVYEGTIFKVDKFQLYLVTNGMTWPCTEKGNLKLDDDTFKDACKQYPQLQSLRDLRYILGQLKLNALSVGADGRNRCLLSPFQSRTGRNQPSNSKFIFGPAVWLRSLIKPEQGKFICYLDWSQQEFGIASALSNDTNMKIAYASGDPYLEFAKQANAVPLDATKKSHKKEREQYKACVLATQYGMGAESLASRINDIVLKARRLLDKHKETYAKFWAWSDIMTNSAILHGCIQTVFGWKLWVESGYNVRMLQNFPMQANGAEMLRLGCILALERGVKVLAPVHDAILIEGDLAEIDAIIATTQKALVDASKIILNGFELRSDADIVEYPNRYMDERGISTFNKVTKILAEIGGTHEEREDQRSSNSVFTEDERKNSFRESQKACIHRRPPIIRLATKGYGL
ncbi:DNA polymerase I [Bacillus sp. AFS077874]|uniref:DNA polymerase n=1 Tax=Bacillus sp. AFS077874 TaxID=2033513 RepID=UPI000BF5CD42|nr:DNA polymerase [Bacillus sp. AFS077874]PFM82705.1 DNA polymerase I [Bacillus sp. AFS077874]